MAAAQGDEDFETTPGYKAPAQVDLNTLQNLDKDDEALNRWKAKLLEGVDQSAGSGDPRRVIVEKMTFVSAEKEMELDLTGDLASIKAQSFTIKEGVQFRLKIDFRVQHEVVAGLRYTDGVYRKALRVIKNNYMLGSYGPKAEVQSAMTPWDEVRACLHQATDVFVTPLPCLAFVCGPSLSCVDLA
ncbi:uncharacterized protein MONBRDRAFT_32357 [Monosiga brevicollis MX1]|uniref:Rho GDP-dissociation inhibitor 1 n=1 Tax=Monosiga brevicollis TaxID=81824 RepID=A9UZ11_MONBE|nr:uncharacterized protein MONBRDRAFT_32357 [Monosiga brevicollis MX1]EDQ89703.1 predicted protein [Monosiga brevicollis MX1]|eukprot:XP_001745732.1 hypothetical protein [Monosiga brevicollis MX1]